MTEELGKGKIASYHDHRADSGAAAEKIEWGVAVQYNAANPNKIETYDGTGDVVGVAIANHYAETRLASVNDSVDGAYVADDAVSFLRRGIIFVEVLEDVVKGEKAVVDNATGNFRPSDTVTVEKSAVVGVFKSSAAANGLAQLEINLP
uniref:structural cement protein Gp24 n=1 Tax=Mycobacteroides abscessus TaxID=36809 RepID=UPI0018E49ED9